MNKQQRERILSNIRASAKSRTWQAIGETVKRGSLKGCRWMDFADEYLRDCGNVQDIMRGHRAYFHSGYYADNHQDGVIVPCVFQLPSRNGKELYAPSVRDPWNNGVAVDLSDLRDTKEEAAKAADALAESWSEECRDDDAKQLAESEIESELDSIAVARADHSALAKEYREATRMQFEMFREGDAPPARMCGQFPALCGAVRKQMIGLREQVHDSIKHVKALRENHWISVG